MNQYTGVPEVVQRVIADVQSAAQVSVQDLMIWGGQFPASRLADFLSVWEKMLIEHLPWRIYEYVSALAVLRASDADPALPHPIDVLERARLFGSGGDLDLRRDEKIFETKDGWRRAGVFYWNFIGDHSIDWPDLITQGFSVQPYHEPTSEPTSEIAYFREIETYTVQWRPNDDRVHGTWKEYTGLAPKNVILTQRRYLRNGKLEFVRFTGLEEYNP